MAETDNGYNIIISGVDEKWVGGMTEIASNFAESFGLAADVAEYILKSHPIAFIANLTREEVRTLKPRMIELSKKGMEFTVASALPQTMPRVVWPAKFNVQELPTGELVQYVDFQWRGNAFVCPACGETYLFRRVGNPFSTFLNKNAPPAQGPAEEGVVEVEPLADDAGLEAAPEESGGNAVEMMPIEEPEPEAVEPPAEVPAPEAIPEPEPEAPIEVGPDGVVELAPMQDEINEATVTSEPIDILQAEHKPAAQPKPQPKPVTRAIPQAVATQAADTSSNEFSLFLTVIPPDKKESAAELIAEIKGIQIAQARLMTNRTMVPVLKDVSGTVAQECLERFKKVGLAGRLVKKK